MVSIRPVPPAFILLSSKTFYQWLKYEISSLLAVGCVALNNSYRDKEHKFEDHWVDWKWFTVTSYMSSLEVCGYIMLMEHKIVQPLWKAYGCLKYKFTVGPSNSIPRYLERKWKPIYMQSLVQYVQCSFVSS